MSETKDISWRSRIWAVIKAALFFSLFGTAIGVVVFWFGYVLLEAGPLSAIFSLVWLLPLGGVGLLVAFYVGFIPALVSGLAIGIYSSFVGALNWKAVLGLGIIVGVLHVVFVGNGGMPPPRSVFVSTFPSEIALQLLTVVTCVTATMLCWLIWTSVAPIPSANLRTSN